MNQAKIHLVERLKWGEDILALTVFFTMVFIPTFETIARIVNFRGIPAFDLMDRFSWRHPGCPPE